MSILLVVCISGLYFWTKTPGDNKAIVSLYIKPGTSLHTIAQMLEVHGLITHPYLFQAAIYGMGQKSSLKAGEYAFKEKISPGAIITKLTKGQVVVHTITIPEGLTTRQIVKLLNQNPALTQILTPPTTPIFLYPNTYDFTYPTTRQNMLHRMEKAFYDVIHPLLKETELPAPLVSMNELITLASLVEKETSRADERAIVAGVFLNRLKIGMPLQCDPTVIYALTQGMGELGRNLTKADLQTPSPFNTYHSKGLPPSPIAHPGLSAIKATLRPTPTQNLYFVADGKGGHVFASTLGAHQKNHALWRRINKDLKNIKK